MTIHTDLKHAEITGPLIQLFFQVYHELGYGFLERVYGNAMEIQGQKMGLIIRQQVPIYVHYEGKIVGRYFADMIINNVVLVELKACKALLEEHEAQLLNYLKATEYEVGFLLNFGPKPR